jgi:hypothetical protein
MAGFAGHSRPAQWSAVAVTGMGLVLPLALAFYLFASDALAFYEPDGFRGIKWGTSLTEAEEILKAFHAKRVLVGDEPFCDSARTSERPADSAVCVANADIESVRVKLYFEFYQDRFVAVTVLSTPTSYAALKRGFIARYGAPTRADRSKKIGPFSEYTSEEMFWEGPTVHIKLSQYVGGPTFTVAVIALRSEVDRQAAEQKKSTDPPQLQK